MTILEITSFFILFGLSGFFSASELAIMSIPNYKINSLIKSGKKGSLSIKNVRENSDKLLITILVGNNIVNTYTAVLATQISINMAVNSGIVQSQAIGISTGIITFLILMFGEIIPKSLATKNAVFIALKVAPILKFMIKLLYPIILIIESIVKLFSKNKVKDKITDEEFKTFIDMGKDSGTIEESEHNKIKSILDFSEIPVSKIMTIKDKIEMIDINSKLEEVKEYYSNNEHIHSRLPVYEGDKNNINHFITIRDILYSGNKEKVKDLNLKSIIKVGLDKKIDGLLEIFQNLHVHIAIVIDEKGIICGVITLENIIEELIGEIKDEKDKL